MSGGHPPRWIRALVERVLGEDAEFVLGDLEEDWRALAASRGQRAADRWYRRQAAGTLGSWLLRSAGIGPGADGRHGASGGGGGMGIDTTLRDLRYAARGLAARPGFTALVVVTLALGIGANAAIFSVVDAVMLRALPYPSPERLVDVAEVIGDDASNRIPTSIVTYREWRDGSTAFETMAATSPFNTLILTGGEEALRLRANFVTPSYLSMLGARPATGRLLQASDGEDLAGDHPVVVLSHGLWQRAFGEDPDVVGRAITLSGETFTVVGVTSPTFHDLYAGAQPTDLYLPLTEIVMVTSPAALDQRVSRLIQVFGRLRADRTLAQATTELEAVTRGIQEREPGSMRDSGVLTQPLREQLYGGLDTPLLALLAGAVFLLVVGCINVASLLVVRGAARAREVALRLALGAPRARLVRQLTTEALLLAVLGGLGGVLLAYGTLDLILGLNQNVLPSWMDVSVDGRVLAASLALSLVTGLVFGLAPAFGSTRADLRSALTRGDPRSGGGRPRPTRHALIVLEVATAMVLLVGSGLMIRSFEALRGAEMGFRTERILSTFVSLPAGAYPDAEDVVGFNEAVVAELEARPGVEFASIWGPGRPGQVGQYTTMLAEGMVVESQLEAPLARFHNVSPGALEALEIPLLAGRTIDANDRQGSQRVVVISEGAATTLFPGEDPIGRLINNYVPEGFDPADFVPYEVIGVVADAEQGGRRGFGAFDVPHDMYFPYAQRGPQSTRFVALLVGTIGDPWALVPVVRDAIRTVDPDVPQFLELPMDEVVAQELVVPRFVAVLMGIFGALSLFLAALGIYGVLSQSVAGRTREVGLRKALGADAGSTVGLFVGQGARLTLAGITVGLLASVGLTRFVASLLFGVAPIDVPTFAATAALLFAVSLVACYLPTRRALKVDPMVALRAE